MLLTLDSLREELLKWDGCALSKQANAVLGEGNPHATVFFVGEAPGQKEDELRRPFVGAAGQLLNTLLERINLKREDVYISNVVKYRPPGNRDPEPIEKEQCMPWLMLELALIKPKVVVPLGRHALGHFLPTISITNAHGRAFKLTDDITIFPIYHPAAALHNGNLRGGLEADFLGLGEHLKSRGLFPAAA
jgi:DNA polymerase